MQIYVLGNNQPISKQLAETVNKICLTLIVFQVQNAKSAGYDIGVLFDPSPEPFEYPNMSNNNFPISRYFKLLKKN